MISRFGALEKKVLKNLKWNGKAKLRKKRRDVSMNRRSSWWNGWLLLLVDVRMHSMQQSPHASKNLYRSAMIRNCSCFSHFPHSIVASPLNVFVIVRVRLERFAVVVEEDESNVHDRFQSHWSVPKDNERSDVFLSEIVSHYFKGKRQRFVLCSDISHHFMTFIDSL